MQTGERILFRAARGTASCTGKNDGVFSGTALSYFIRITYLVHEVVHVRSVSPAASLSEPMSLSAGAQRSSSHITPCKGIHTTALKAGIRRWRRERTRATLEHIHQGEAGYPARVVPRVTTKAERGTATGLRKRRGGEGLEAAFVTLNIAFVRSSGLVGLLSENVRSVCVG